VYRREHAALGLVGDIIAVGKSGAIETLNQFAELCREHRFG
jgi:hypothetical protein